MLIRRQSPVSGKINELEIDVTEEELLAWKHGELIQIAMPRADANEREFIRTGITKDEWDELFDEE